MSRRPLPIVSTVDSPTDTVERLGRSGILPPSLPDARPSGIRIVPEARTLLSDLAAWTGLTREAPLARLFVLGQAYRVVSLQIDEAMSLGYGCTLEVEVDQPELLAPRILASRASVKLESGFQERVMPGTIRSVTLCPDREGERGHQSYLRVELACRLWQLRDSRRSRVFQHRRTRQIIEEVLRLWQVPMEWAVSAPQCERDYCVQYQESDFDFVRRILAEDGYCFFITCRTNDEGIDEDVVRIGDGPPAYESVGLVGTMRRGPHHERSEETIEWLTSTAEVGPRAALLRDYDPDHPLFIPEIRHAAPRSDGEAGRSPSQVFEFAPARWPGGVRETAAAATFLRQERGQAPLVRGKSSVRALAVGRLVRVEGHSVAGLDATYVVTRILSRGKAPGRLLEDGSDDEGHYENEFEAISADAPAVPTRLPPRLEHALQTAVVEGAGGAETATDSLGRVRVRFHWDTGGAPAGAATCAVRVSQSWAGPGYGAFFLPRTGMEVLVAFLHGDVDRPIIIGTVANATCPPPFALPAGSTKSGFVTRSSPGGTGYNELSFEDQLGAECVTLRAERDLRIDVQHDCVVRTSGNASHQVSGDFSEVTLGRHTREVRGASETSHYASVSTRVEGDSVTHVCGASTTTIGGPSTHTLAGTLACEVSGESTVRMREHASLEFARELSLRVGRDAVARFDGGAVVVVGSSDKPESMLIHAAGDASIEASRALLISSDKEIVLSVGNSRIHISPNGIELDTPKLTLRAPRLEGHTRTLALSASERASMVGHETRIGSDQGASLSLTQNAELDGQRVRLHSGSGGTTSSQESAPVVETVIELTTQDGEPIPHEPFVCTAEGGETLRGVLDDEGRAVLRGLSGPHVVRFIGLANVRPSSAPEPEPSDE